MEYIRKENEIVVRLDKGEELISSLLTLAQKENILTASITGLGASNKFMVGILDLNTKEFKGKTYEVVYEITNIVGNLTTKEDKPYLHLHATFASLDTVVGGHLTEAYISATAEILIHVIDLKVDRKFDSNTGLNLFKFNH